MIKDRNKDADKSIIVMLAGTISFTFACATTQIYYNTQISALVTLECKHLAELRPDLTEKLKQLYKEEYALQKTCDDVRYTLQDMQSKDNGRQIMSPYRQQLLPYMQKDFDACVTNRKDVLEAVDNVHDQMRQLYGAQPSLMELRAERIKYERKAVDYVRTDLGEVRCYYSPI